MSKTYTREQIAEKVKKIICDLTRAIPEKVTLEAKFEEDLGSALNFWDMVCVLEREFGIDEPADEWEEIQTVGQAIDFVAGKVGAA